MRLVLDPAMESFSDTNSFGFRKNRQFKSALAVVKYLLKDKYCDKLILNASVKIFCDNLLYDWLFKNVPLTHILKNFLTN
jgi:RNA-directed DNA polymerase